MVYNCLQLQKQLEERGFVGETAYKLLVDYIANHIRNEFADINGRRMLEISIEVMNECEKDKAMTYKEFGKRLCEKVKDKGNIPLELYWKKAQELAKTLDDFNERKNILSRKEKEYGGHTKN